MTDRVGKLLIAHPNLPSDNWFHRTVIYIYAEKPKDGTLGICLNMNGSYSLKQLCYDKGIIYPDSNTNINIGGPVSRSSIIMLHTDEWSSHNTIEAGDSYSLSSDIAMFERLSLGDQPGYWKIFAGLCAWGPGQLDLELSGKFPYKNENSWLTAKATDDIIFNYDGEDQWKKAIELSSQQMIDSLF